VEDILRNSVSQDKTLNVVDLIQPAPYTVTPETNVKAVLGIMEQENVWVLPVLDGQDRYLGFVSKTAIFNKYRALLSRQADYME
jgi:CIC family chloride channel protein